MLLPMPRASNCQGPLPAVLNGKESSLSGGGGGESQEEVERTRAGVFWKGKKRSWDDPLSDLGLEGGEDEDLLCFT